MVHFGGGGDINKSSGIQMPVELASCSDSKLVIFWAQENKRPSQGSAKEVSVFLKGCCGALLEHAILSVSLLSCLHFSGG